MTHQEDNFKLYIDERFNSISTLLNANFINVQDKLESIEKQTIKTNGRVLELEKMSNIHTIAINNYSIKCPQEPRLRTLEDTSLSAKAVKGWIIASISVASVILGGAWIIVKLFSGV